MLNDRLYWRFFMPEKLSRICLSRFRCILLNTAVFLNLLFAKRLVSNTYCIVSLYDYI